MEKWRGNQPKTVLGENDMDKDSGISRNNHHNLLMGRVTARYAMEWMTLCRVGTQRGVLEHLVPVVYSCGVWTKEHLRQPKNTQHDLHEMHECVAARRSSDRRDGR